ncbi:MAG: hypothetical protein ACNS62_17985 [Candidatus Cyclobacteriaceae bacterium M3_2C_046]
MGYYLNLEEISIETFQDILAKAYFPPSRVILRDRTDQRFDFFKNQVVQDLKQLLLLLQNKDQMKSLQQQEYFSGSYLKVLICLV